MANNLSFTINVTLERIQGKFISNDELADEIQAEIEGANPGSVQVDESEYEIVDFEVERA